MIGEIRQNFTEASASVGLILATALATWNLFVNLTFLLITMTYHCIFPNSFCNLTVEIAVQVNAVRGLMEEIPTFVVLGSSSLIIIIMVVSAYYTLFRCVD